NKKVPPHGWPLSSARGSLLGLFHLSLQVFHHGIDLFGVDILRGLTGLAAARRVLGTVFEVELALQVFEHLISRPVRASLQCRKFLLETGALRPFQFLEGIDLGFYLVYLRFESIEGLKGRRLLHARELVLDLLLGLCPAASGNEEVLLPLRFFYFLLQRTERLFQLFYGLVLSLPLLLEALRVFLAGLLLENRLLRHPFEMSRALRLLLCGPDGKYCLALPFLGLIQQLRHLPFEFFLVGNGASDAPFALDELRVHVQDNLAEHLLRIFCLANELIYVRAEHSLNSVEKPHDILPQDWR